MKYQKVKIYCHPRSGSNYLTELIDLNFYKSGNYKKWYGGHILPKSELLDDTNTGFIYIYRNFEDVLKSTYKLKERFGLSCSSIEDLRRSKYKSIFNPNLKTSIKVKHHNESRSENSLSHHFEGVNMTPEEYHAKHVGEWLKNSGRENFISVRYEDLMTDFSKEMGRIAEFLDMADQKDQYEDIEERIGYIPTELDMKTRLANAISSLFFRVKKKIKSLY